MPKWDGNNVYEGLIIFAEREDITDLSEWLRLTSLVCNQYRRCARAQRLVTKQEDTRTLVRNDS
jgi:hypothetical protein